MLEAELGTRYFTAFLKVSAAAHQFTKLKGAMFSYSVKLLCLYFNIMGLLRAQIQLRKIEPAKAFTGEGNWKHHRFLP